MDDQSVAVYAFYAPNTPISHLFLGEEASCYVKGVTDAEINIELRTQDRIVKLYCGTSSSCTFQMFLTSLGTHVIIINVIKHYGKLSGEAFYQKIHVTPPLSLKIKTIDDFYYNNVVIEAVLENVSGTDMSISCKHSGAQSFKESPSTVLVKAATRLHKTFIVKSDTATIGGLDIAFDTRIGSHGRLKTGEIQHIRESNENKILMFAHLLYISEKEGVLKVQLTNLLTHPLTECEFQLANDGKKSEIKAVVNHHYIHKLEDTCKFEFNVHLSNTKVKNVYPLKAILSFVDKDGSILLRPLETQLILSTISLNEWIG